MLDECRSGPPFSPTGPHRLVGLVNEYILHEVCEFSSTSIYSVSLDLWNAALAM